MLTDVEIAQSSVMEPIKNVAEKIGLTEDDLELYGKYKAKISLETIKKVENNPDGKLILVTAINPTPAGVGKTTTMIGLSQALHQLGKVVQLVEDMPRLFLWKISTFISQVIFMLSLQQIT